MIAALAALLLIAAPATAEAARRKARIKGEGETLAFTAYQRKHALTPAQMLERFGAAGRIRCPWGAGTAFLVGAGDIFVTSGHLFTQFDPAAKRWGGTRGSVKRCAFHPLIGKGGRYRIVASSLRQGVSLTADKTDPFQLDWAVGQLDKPVAGVEPFRPGPLLMLKGHAVVTVSQGMNDFIPRISTCAVSDVVGRPHALNQWWASVAAFKTTCGTGPGASGGPILTVAPGGTEPLAVIGLTLGWAGTTAAEAQHVALPVEEEVMLAVARLMKNPRDVVELAASYREAAGPPAQQMGIARRLYLVAAGRGAADAYYWLGKLHYNSGLILPNDEVEAYGWLELAQQSLPATDPLRGEATRLLETLSGRLDAAGIARARERVKALITGGG